LFFVSCSKQQEPKWVYYDETVCADRWPGDGNNEKLKQNIIDYAKKKGFTIFELELIIDGTSDPCSDCNCRTGRRVHAKIPQSDFDAARSERFYEEI
jgi:predicted GNAT superfamily acetyltransferase